MAAVTGPGRTTPARWARRRFWWAAMVATWIALVLGLGFWSVRRDPATVPDQRDIVAAVGDLQRAVGVVFAAADGDSRVVVLGELVVARDCHLTAVRRGMTARRDLTVYVREGEARVTLDSIAAGLPESYQAFLSERRGGVRLSLHADAGNFVGVDSDARAQDGVLTVEVSTGCRPPGSTEPDKSDPAAGLAPARLGSITAKLGGSGAPAVEAAACPEGGVAATYMVDGIAVPSDLADKMQQARAGATPVRADQSIWAYRTGKESVAVVPDGKRVRVSVTSGC